MLTPGSHHDTNNPKPTLIENPNTYLQAVSPNPNINP